MLFRSAFDPNGFDYFVPKKDITYKGASLKTVLTSSLTTPRNKDSFVFIYTTQQKKQFDKLVKELDLTQHIALLQDGLHNGEVAPQSSVGRLTVAILTRFGKRYPKRVQLTQFQEQEKV